MTGNIAITMTDDGRWEWAAIAVENDFSGGRVSGSVISFPSRIDAENDFQQHLAAQPDSTGKLVRSKDEIQWLISVCAESCPECTDTFFGGVYWHELDVQGCNWSVSTMNSLDPGACFDQIQPLAIMIRSTYNIPNEG